MLLLDCGLWGGSMDFDLLELNDLINAIYDFLTIVLMFKLDGRIYSFTILDLLIGCAIIVLLFFIFNKILE